VIWSVDRASGIAALLLSSLSIVAGLLQARRSRLLKPADRFPLHEALGIAVVVAIALHTASYAVDGFFKAGVVGALVPFASPYRPLAVALGQIAAYGLVGLSVTFYVRRRIGTPRWRAAHRLIPVFWGLAVVHGVTAGSDATQPWFLVSALLPVGAALVMLAARAEDRASSDRRPTRSGSARGPVAPTRTAPGASPAGR
jgi:predicted ferric reductase